MNRRRPAQIFSSFETSSEETFESWLMFGGVPKQDIVDIFKQGLLDLWNHKIKLRQNRRTKLVRSETEGSTSFDIYGFNSAQFDKIPDENVKLLISSLLVKLQKGSSKSAAGNNFLKVIYDKDNIPSYMVHLASPGDPEYETEMAPWENGPEIDILSPDVPIGLKRLFLAILNFIYENTYLAIPRWETSASDAQKKNVFITMQEKFRAKISRWGVVPRTEKLVIKEGDPISPLNDKINEYISELIGFASYRVLHYGVTAKPVGREELDGTVVEEDDAINPEVVGTDGLYNLSMMSKEDLVYYAESRLLKVYGIMKRLENVVGIENIKRNVLAFVKSIIMKPILILFQPSHMVFVGPPGTGKTTIATIIGDVIKALGILNSPLEMLTVSRSTFVAPYEGQTAIKTRKALLTNAFDNVMFFDEAYQLVQSEKDSMGVDALNALFQFMNEYPEFILILAGYESQIDESLFSMQPGLARRTPYSFKFEGYNSKELMEIADRMINDFVAINIIDGIDEDGKRAIFAFIDESMNTIGQNTGYEKLYLALAEIDGFKSSNARLRIDRGKDIFNTESGKSYIDRLLADALYFGNYAGDVRNFVLLCNRLALEQVKFQDRSRNGVKKSVIDRKAVASAREVFIKQKADRVAAQIKTEKNKSKQK